MIIAGTCFFAIQVYEYKQNISNETVVVADNYSQEIKIVIPAHGEKEHKFRIEKDKKIIYTWEVSNSVKLFYDFHGDPDGAKDGYFKSYKENTAFSDKGVLSKSPVVLFDADVTTTAGAGVIVNVAVRIEVS